MKPIVLVGPGGHCRSCIDVIESTQQYEIVAVVGQENEVGGEVSGYPISHVDAQLPELVSKYSNFLVTIGQIKSNAIRVKLFETITELGGELPSIVSPTAHVSRTTVLGHGTIVMHMAVVNAEAKVGNNCIINTRCLIEHDAEIGDHCHISTGAIVNGGTTVEANCFIGSGSIIRQAFRIEAGSIIGAGQWIDGKQKNKRG